MGAPKTCHAPVLISGNAPAMNRPIVILGLCEAAQRAGDIAVPRPEIVDITEVLSLWGGFVEDLLEVEHPLPESSRCELTHVFIVDLQTVN